MTRHDDSVGADPRIVAIRADEKVGGGTCSSIDECWSNKDLFDYLEGMEIDDPAKAVEWARGQEELFLEQGLNQRWGDDDDPQLEAYNKFKKDSL